MKKATIETNLKTNLPFIKMMEGSPNGLLMVMFNHKHRPRGMSTLAELITKYKLSEATVKIYRATEHSFPHPVAIQQGNPNLTYLYGDMEFAAWVESWSSKKMNRQAKKIAEAERMLERARKLERKAYALRRKRQGFNIQITQGGK